MGKLKVSFTTALFVFSFIICVIVAVAFVDRAPKNDYDAFYEGDRAGDGRGGAERDNESAGSDAWGDGKTSDRNIGSAPAQAPAASEANLAELPIDPHLAGSIQPIAASPAPVAISNPMAGRSPDDIARTLMGNAGINASVQAATIPGMAVPPGIATPVGAIQATPASSRYTPSAYLPLQSNTQPGGAPSGLGAVPPPAVGYQGATGNPGASGLYATPSLSATTNASNQWNQVQAKETPSSMVGVRSAPARPQDGMMISDGRSATGVAPPAGFENTITQDSAAPVAPAVPGGLDQPLLLAPQPGTGSNKWDLPPAPTLRPPPVQDPDRRRSEAESDKSEAESPDSLNPDGSSGQALAVSEETPQGEDADAEPAVAARVNDKMLTDDQALRLAQVNFVLKDQTLTSEHREEEAKKAAAEWEEITLAAAVAEKLGLTVPAPDIERYAEMRPDFDAAAWQSAMAEKNFPEKEIRDNLTAIALSEKLVELEFEKEFAEEKIREAYDKKPSRFTTQRKVHLMEIFKDKPEDEKRSKKVAGEMRRLQRQAAAGTDFGLLARQASQSPTRGKGGNMGWITPAQETDEDRDKALGDLKPGEVTEVLEEPTGFRIYKLVDVKEATNDFEGGKDLVVAELKTSVRKTCFGESREKLEAGISPEDEMESAMAALPAAKEKVADKSDGTDVTSAAKNGEEAEDAARREKAQELLAESARRRRATEKQQIAGATPRQSGGGNHVLYAPGTQVQQLGGQPAPAYQPGGQLAAPVQNPLTAPESVSVNYPPGTAMRGNSGGQIGNSFAGANPSVLQPAEFQSVAMDPSGVTAAAMQAQGLAQGQGGQAANAAVTPEVSRSNGWVVSRTSDAPVSANQRAASATARPPAEAGAAAIAGGDVPPGFEGSGAGSADASTAAQQQSRPKGVVGSVKSFFGGLRK